MTQRAARRLFATGALCVVALGALSACAGQPGAAAIVGKTRITTAQVDDSIATVLSTCDAARTAAPASPSPAPSGGTATPSQPSPVCQVGVDELRSIALQDKVTIAVASRYAAEHGIKTPVVDPQTLAQEGQNLGLKPDDPFVVDLVNATSWVNALEQAATPVTPTNAELMDIYNIGVARGITTDTFAQDKAVISQIGGLGQALAVKRELSAAADQYGVSISPRYQPTAVVGSPADAIQIPLLDVNQVVVLAVNFGQTSSPAVANQPSAVPTGDSTPGGGEVGP